MIRHTGILMIMAMLAQGRPLLRAQNPVIIHRGDLTATFIDNSALGEFHRAGYNGIAELKHTAQDSTLFVPFYAGFNLEHVFGGDRLDPLFEPRKNSMHIRKTDEHAIELHQEKLPFSHVESTTTFRMTPPYYIDVEVRYIIHDETFFPHGYAGLYWASYINKPADKGINFYGLKNGSKHMEWIRAYSPEHGVASTHIAEDDRFVMYNALDFNVTLASHYSDFRYAKPFYYGRFHNMVFAYLFDVPEGQILRFAQSPTGGGETNPAWDFYILNPDFKVGKEYSFKVRLVYKPFAGNEDIAREYDRWISQNR